MMILPTGTQYEIEHGDLSAVVTEVGATLRSLTRRGRELLWTFGAEEVPRGFAGATLLPWPNRIRDGAYRFGDESHQLAISEPGFNTAIHGLAVALPWAMTARTRSSITLAAVVYPQPGWAGTVRVALTYALDGDGLTVRFRSENAGDVAVPFGYGAHPLFAFPDLDEVQLSLPFGRQLQVDERLLPTGLGDVEEALDFREPRPIGRTGFDTAFTGAPERWEVRAKGPDHAITLWADEAFDWVQLYSSPDRTGLAIEPMTCGPDAFNEGPTHDDVVTLAPGGSTSGSWGVRVS